MLAWELLRAPTQSSAAFATAAAMSEQDMQHIQVRQCQLSMQLVDD